MVAHNHRGRIDGILKSLTCIVHWSGFPVDHLGVDNAPDTVGFFTQLVLLCGSAFFGVCAHWAEGSLITIDKDLDSAQIYRDLELGIANGGGNMPVFLGTLCEPLVVCPLV